MPYSLADSTKNDATYRLIKSMGPLIPSPLPPGPEEMIIPFPPVIRMTSLAFVKKFWRNLRATSPGIDVEGYKAGE